MNSDLKKYLKEVDAVLVSSWGNITYLTNYSGFSKEERECFLLITKRKRYLITDRRYSKALGQIKDFEIIDVGALNFIFKDHSNILKNLRTSKVGIEENDLTVTEYKKLKKRLKHISNIDMSKLRIIKQKFETENIKKACTLGDTTFKFIAGKLKAGVSELQIANEIEFFIRKKGAEISFKPVVAFGRNSAIPHHLSNQTKLRQNQIVLLDFGVKINNYCSDMTRTVFFGRAPAKFKKMHKTVLEAQTKTIDFLKSSIINLPAGKAGHKSITGRDIDKIARDYIIKQGYPNIIHSVGHGIGIEVHEAPYLSPKSKDRIKERMVFSVEPGIYITGYGGVRIEDLVVVGKSGAELISNARREIIEV